MDELNRKIDGMVADLETRVQTVQEQATAATELKTETHNLLEAVRAAAKNANELAHAVKDGVETQRETLADGRKAMEGVAGEARATVTTLRDEAESTLQKLQGTANLMTVLDKRIQEVFAAHRDEQKTGHEEMKRTLAIFGAELERHLARMQATTERRETGLEYLMTALDKKIREAFAAQHEEQERTVREEMERILAAFGKQSRAELERQLTRTQWVAAISAVVAAIAAIASIAALL